MREGRARKHSDLCAGASLGSDVVQQLAALLLDSLCAEHHRDVALRRLVKDRAHVLRGCDHQPGVALVKMADVGRGADRRIEWHAGKEQLIFVTVVDRIGDLVLHRPQERLASARRRDLRERCPPRAAAEDADLVEAHAFTPAPRTFSASESSGQRARAGTSSGSVSPAAKRSAPAQAIIAALSVQSQAGGTRKARLSRAARSATAMRIASLAAP